RQDRGRVSPKPRTFFSVRSTWRASNPPDRGSCDRPPALPFFGPGRAVSMRPVSFFQESMAVAAKASRPGTSRRRGACWTKWADAPRLPRTPVVPGLMSRRPRYQQEGKGHGNSIHPRPRAEPPGWADLHKPLKEHRMPGPTYRSAILAATAIALTSGVSTLAVAQSQDAARTIANNDRIMIHGRTFALPYRNSQQDEAAPITR